MALMVHRLVYLILIFYASLAAQAHAASRTPFYEAVRGKQVVYVLGTVHFGREDFYPLRAPVESALKASRKLFLEIDLNQETELEFARSMLCEQACLKQALSDAEWRKLGERLGQQEAILQQLERVQPWAAGIMLAVGDYMALGLDPTAGTEKYLKQILSKNTRVIALEQPQDQLRVFSEMPAAMQKEMLVQWLEMTPEQRLDSIRDLIRLWQAGDADAMHTWFEALQKRYASSPELEAHFNRKVITERNQRFVKSLLAEIKSDPGPHFIAVGALHLGGPEGVLSLLKQRGYAIRLK